MTWTLEFLFLPLFLVEEIGENHCLTLSHWQLSHLPRPGFYELTEHVSMTDAKRQTIQKGKGIRFIVLYPPKCSHDLPPLAGTVHTETISIPRGIFQSNWQHIAHTL